MKHGIYPGLGMDVYHAWSLDKSNLKAGPLSRSMLKRFAENPLSWFKSGEFTQTDAMRIGSLFDLALTDPQELESSVVVSPFDSYRTKEAKEWKAANADKIPVTGEELDHAKQAAEACHNHAIAGAILDGAEFQVGVIGEIKGIPAKSLIDILPSEDGDWCETLVDYKTTSMGLDDESLSRSIYKFGYHFQASFYRSLFNHVSPDRVCEDFAVIFQDTKTLEVRVVKLSDDALMLGNAKVKEAIEEYLHCAENGIKSRYADSADTINLPAWAMNQTIEEQ